MLEEDFKAIEGLVTRRQVQERSVMQAGTVYCASNKAYEAGVPAASEVLSLDALVCEDSVRHAVPLCRVPADYVNYFNTIELPVVDACMQARGIPDGARRFYQEAFADISVCVQTRWGETLPIQVTRGLPQGSVSGTEGSKPAQEPILRLREDSAAKYRSSAGRLVACAGYVDDTEHYGAGAEHLPIIVRELGAASHGTGIGYSWHKFSAYATDWDAYAASPVAAAHGLTDTGIEASGWDIWHGGTVTVKLPRALRDTTEKLLGKTGCVLDKHTLARQDLLEKVQGTRKWVSMRRCAWDEIAAMYQLTVRGSLSYAPLIGFLDPMSMHAEDAAFQRLALMGWESGKLQKGLACR